MVMKQKFSVLATVSSGGANQLVRQTVVTSVVALSSMMGCKDILTVSSGPASEVFSLQPHKQGSNFFNLLDFASGYFSFRCLFVLKYGYLASRHVHVNF